VGGKEEGKKGGKERKKHSHQVLSLKRYLSYWLLQILMSGL